MSWVVRLLLLVPLLALLSCDRGAECDPDNPCGFGADCIDGQCVVHSCATSAQCPMEHFCKGRDCLPGCEVDGDCYPGDRCDTELSECVEAPCEETKVDCGFREFCNAANGECYDAGGDFCKPCHPDTVADDCVEGNECIGYFCSVDCSAGRECPAGFDCYGFEDGYGNVVFYGCYTYCWLYEDYEPGSFPMTLSEALFPFSPVDTGAEVR